MNTRYHLQKGASAISNVILLAVLGIGVYLGIQYFPHFIEIRVLESVLDSLESGQQTNPTSNAQEVTSWISTLLNINHNDDLRSAFTVRENGSSIVVTAVYDWELNVLYGMKPMHFERTVTLQ